VDDQLPASNPQKKVLGAYRKDYEGKFKQDVSAFGGHSWDAMKLIAQAIRTAKSAEPAAIRDALEKTKKFWGIGGEFNLSPADHSGLTEDALVLVKVTKGDWELLK
jgi:branched-chain amino acid transport system substrate-binding protein